MKIKIITEHGEAVAELNNTKTASMIFSRLPIKGRANIWGEEIYFDIPVNMELEEPSKQEMDVGDLAYWPPGNAFCIFFGKTPASINEKPRAASEVTSLGRVLDINLFKKIKNGEKIILDKI